MSIRKPKYCPECGRGDSTAGNSARLIGILSGFALFIGLVLYNAPSPYIGWYNWCQPIGMCWLISIGPVTAGFIIGLRIDNEPTIE